MAYQFQLGELKLPSGASIDTQSGDIELGNKQVDAPDLNVDDAKLNFAELIFNYSEPSNHTTDNAGEGGNLTFQINSKFYKIQFSDAADTAGFTSGNGSDSGNAFTMNIDTVASRDISAMCDAIVTGLQDGTNGLDAKVANGAKYTIAKITTGSNSNREISIRSTVAGNTFNFASPQENISSMNAPNAIAYTQVNLFNMSTDDVFATKTAAEVAAALPIMSNNNPSFTGTLTVGDAVLSEAELEILDGATISTAELNRLSGVTSDVQTQISNNDGDITDILSFAGRSDGDTNMGTYTGSTISDNQNIKQNLQQLETAVESKHPTIDSTARLNANLIGANGDVSNAEYGFLNGVTSSIQSQLNSAAMTKANLTALAATYDGTETLVFGDDGNDMTFQIRGNLRVDGVTTTINSTTMTIDDKDLVLASGAADSAAANGAGITIDGASASILYSHTGTKFAINKPIDVTGKMVSSAGLEIGNGQTIGAGNDPDMLTLNQGSDITVEAGVELRVAEDKLKIGGTLVTASAAELNVTAVSRKPQALTSPPDGGGSINPSNGHMVILIPNADGQTYPLPQITANNVGLLLRIKNANGGSRSLTLSKHASNASNSLEGANSVTLNAGAAISCIAIDTGGSNFQWVIM